MTQTPLPVQGPVDVNVSRKCTCHTDDKPPTPCAKQYAFHECVSAARSEPSFCWHCGRALKLPSFAIVIDPAGHQHRVHKVCQKDADTKCRLVTAQENTANDVVQGREPVLSAKRPSGTEGSTP